MFQHLHMDDILQCKGLKIGFWNIRSIIGKIESLRAKLSDETISILVISESWLKPDIPNSLIEIEGYTLHRMDRKILNDRGFLKRGGGIIVYIKNSLAFDTVNGDLFNISNNDTELTTLCIKRPHTRRLYLISLYRPPTGKVRNCIDALDNCLKFLPFIDKSDIFLGGDFNIDFEKHRQENTKKLKHFALQYHLTQLIKDGTRPLQSDSVIDLIFSNCTNIQAAGILPWNISDHVPVIVNIKKKKSVMIKAEFKGRSYKRFDKEIFINSLVTKHWPNFDNNLDVDKQWDILYNNVIETLDEQIPVKTFLFPKSKPEWLVVELAEYMKDRDSLLNKARRTKLPEDKKTANRARNRTNRMIKNAKNNFIKEKLNNYMDNPKKFWEQIKSTYPSDNSKNPIRLYDEQGNTLSDLELATTINNYFTNIGPNLARSAQEMIKDQDPTLLHRIKHQRIPDCPILTLRHPAMPELLKRINDIKPYKSSGVPLVASRIWKIVFQNMPHLLDNIIKTSIDFNIFPKKWKIATVVPIPKTSKTMGPEDLRPISLLPLPGKIFEHLIYSQIDNFLEQNNLLTKSQNGFRSKHSTIQTVFDFANDLINSYNDDCETIAIYIDFKKAFDTVNHNLLLGKLTSFNFDESTCLLLKSYLTHRSQMTFINGNTSGSNNISYGVPQGSVLGPKLFLIFINDLVKNIQNSKYFLYADDIVMFKRLTKDNTNEDLVLFKQDIKAVETWCLINELTINIKKTKLQFFPSNRNTDCSNFENEVACHLYGQRLSYVNTFKYLGIDIDKNLNMKSFYDSMYKLVSHKFYLLKLIRPSLTIEAALAVCKSMILSLIDYGNIFLTSVTQEDRSDLQKLQNKILRCCINIVDPMDVNVVDMHDLVNVEFVDKRRTYNLLTVIHSNVQNGKVDMLDHNVNTRYNDGCEIDLIKPRNEHVRKSSLYTGMSAWNNLSLNLRQLDIHTFKKKIKENIRTGEVGIL